MAFYTRATYYWALKNPERPRTPDPITGDVVAIWRDSRGEYGAPHIKMRLAAKGVTASRRRIRRVMAADGTTYAS